MATSKQPLVSVVTPVYNGDAYLTECIESVLAQTYENWEYVIVNNCSTDRTLEIAERYAKKESRIRICNNESMLDALPNHNHALRQISADSKYCKVLQADDWLFPECISRMVEVAEQHPSVRIVGSYRLDEDKVNLDGLPYPSTVVSGRDVCRWHLLALGKLYVFGSPTSLLICSDLVRKRENFYNETHMEADKEVCFDLLQECDFGFVHQVLTFTRRHNESRSSFARKLNTLKLGRIRILKRCGPIFLSGKEYSRTLKLELDYYHEFLARTIISEGKSGIFRYHKKELAKLGVPVNSFKLIKTMLLQFMNIRQTISLWRKGKNANNQS